jgi:large subunit ribosomal protein L10
MALSRDKKNEIMAELEQLFASSKMTVVAQYKGLTVKNIQALRAEARTNGTTIKVVKNRLVRKAMEKNEALKGVDSSALRDMLMYVFNPEDETAGAQVLAKFAKKNPEVQFVGGITADGTFMDAAQIKTFASLPSKNELVAGIVSILQSPTRNVMAQLTGNLHGMLDAIAAKATN